MNLDARQQSVTNDQQIINCASNDTLLFDPSCGSAGKEVHRPLIINDPIGIHLWGVCKRTISRRCSSDDDGDVRISQGSCNEYLRVDQIYVYLGLTLHVSIVDLHHGDPTTSECLMKSSPIRLTEVCNPFCTSITISQLMGHQDARWPALQNQALGTRNIQKHCSREGAGFEFCNVPTCCLCEYH